MNAERDEKKERARRGTYSRHRGEAQKRQEGGGRVRRTDGCHVCERVEEGGRVKTRWIKRVYATYEGKHGPM
jgi:hypothetical protein